ncbi:hypothetical protein K402DRAFT_459273 [Aulographum hederae CBS 113979]|uniref:Uncharacterized protein n=1 Tax=Aulographum hederae CBS 113979 TaxID=1176131 RepID=A0A6G1HG69_9PEZI|nr:hypothetical protein K402DRAFT_459273 [Aulographum hederae CBS 113979]
MSTAHASTSNPKTGSNERQHYAAFTFNMAPLPPPPKALCESLAAHEANPISREMSRRLMQQSQARPIPGPSPMTLQKMKDIQGTDSSDDEGSDMVMSSSPLESTSPSAPEPSEVESGMSTPKKSFTDTSFDDGADSSTFNSSPQSISESPLAYKSNKEISVRKRGKRELSPLTPAPYSAERGLTVRNPDESNIFSPSPARFYSNPNRIENLAAEVAEETAQRRRESASPNLKRHQLDGCSSDTEQEMQERQQPHGQTSIFFPRVSFALPAGGRSVDIDANAHARTLQRGDRLYQRESESQEDTSPFKSPFDSPEDDEDAIDAEDADDEEALANTQSYLIRRLHEEVDNYRASIAQLEGQQTELRGLVEETKGRLNLLFGRERMILGGVEEVLRIKGIEGNEAGTGWFGRVRKRVGRLGGSGGGKRVEERESELLSEIKDAVKDNMHQMRLAFRQLDGGVKKVVAVAEGEVDK